MITQPKIIHKKKGEKLQHKIQEVHKNYLTLITPSGKTYNSPLSSKVKLSVITPKDTAIVDVDTWRVVDIIKAKSKPSLSDEEEELEAQRQADELMDMGYDY